MRASSRETPATFREPGIERYEVPLRCLSPCADAQKTFGNIVAGVFQPLLAKHSKSFSLVDAIAVGVDRMQRNFEPMRQRVETWRQTELSNVTAKMIIYQAFIEGDLDVRRRRRP